MRVKVVQYEPLQFGLLWFGNSMAILRAGLAISSDNIVDCGTLTCAVIIDDSGRLPFEELHQVQDGVA